MYYLSKEEVEDPYGTNNDDHCSYIDPLSILQNFLTSTQSIHFI